MSADPIAEVRAFAGLWQAAPQPLIANLRARVQVASVGDAVLPISFSDRADVPNCYLCCPSVGYRDYGIAEARLLSGNPLLRGAVVAGLRLTGPLLRATGLDHQCQINNWFLATNPPLQMDPAAVVGLMQRLAAAHSDRAILCRSVNDLTDAALLAAARQAGLVLLPARQVWVRLPGGRAPRDLRRDRALLMDSQMQVVDGETFGATEFATAAQLYAQLYLQKYTPLNPQYSAAFLHGLAAAGVLRLSGLRDDAGQMLGVVGVVTLGGMLTAPVVGYRTDLPQSLGLYRRLMAIATDQAQSAGLPCHLSAGAAEFKRNRGAVPAIEYTIAAVAHLPAAQRRATAVLAAALNRVGVPILRRFAL